LDVGNYLIQIGFKAFFNIVLRSYGIKLFSSPFEQVFSSSSSKSLTNDPKVVLTFFLGGEATSSRFNLSHSVGGYVHIFS
jgi:hypothetical protein